jgi:hypothetical protein
MTSRHVYRLTFSAHLASRATGKRETDARKLRQLDGVTDSFDLASNVLDGELPGIELLHARPVLRFAPRKRDLHLEVDFVISRAVTDRDRELLARFWQRRVMSGWGLNYEPELPASLSGYAVHFEARPREKTPRVAARQLAPVIARYKRIRLADLDRKSDQELAAICAELAPHASELQVTGSAGARVVAKLYTAARTRLQHRAAERAGAGVPKVSAENLDAIDDLPDDVF